MIDVVGAVGVEIAQRIIRQGGEMDDRVEAGQGILLDFTKIDAERSDVVEPGTEITAREELGIEADHVVAGGPQKRDEHGADVTGVTGDQNSHRASIPNIALRQ